MNTNLISCTIIGFLTINIIFQFIISLIYNWKFIQEYLNNKKSTWNPNIDRIKLAASLSFTLFSIMLSKLIIKSNTHILELIIVILSVVLLSFLTHLIINKPNDCKNDTKEIETLKFKPLNQSTHDELKSKIINEKRAIINDSELLLLSEGKKLEHKLKWTDKIGQKSSTKSRNKEITYGFIFDIFHDYFIEGGIKNLKGNKRKELLNFIIENFNKDDQQIKYENLNKSFTNWNPLKV
jgi:hypothetical protein